MCVLDAGEVECGGGVPDTAGNGETEDVEECGGYVFELELGLDGTEEVSGHVFGPSFVGVEFECGVGDGVLDVSPRICGIRELGGVVETVLVADGVSSTAVVGLEVVGSDNPKDEVGGMVEVEFEGILLEVCCGNGVCLTLECGDEHFMVGGGECGTLFGVQVDVCDEELGNEFSGLKCVVGVAIDGDATSWDGGGERVPKSIFNEQPLFGVGGVVLVMERVLHDDACNVFNLGKGDLDFDFVVSEGDEGQGQSLFKEVLVEKEGDLDEKVALLGSKFDQVCLDGFCVVKFADGFTDTCTGTLCEFLPEEHVVGVKCINVLGSNFQGHFLNECVPDGVHPVDGGGVIGRWDDIRRITIVLRRILIPETVRWGLKGGKGNPQVDIGDQVTVTGDGGGCFLCAKRDDTVHVLPFKILREVGVLVVGGFEECEVGVLVDVIILSALCGNLDNSSTSGHVLSRKFF